jgi:hypothetical protein
VHKLMGGPFDGMEVKQAWIYPAPKIFFPYHRSITNGPVCYDVEDVLVHTYEFDGKVYQYKGVQKW